MAFLFVGFLASSRFTSPPPRQHTTMRHRTLIIGIETVAIGSWWALEPAQLLVWQHLINAASWAQQHTSDIAQEICRSFVSSCSSGSDFSVFYNVTLTKRQNCCFNLTMSVRTTWPSSREKNIMVWHFRLTKRCLYKFIFHNSGSTYVPMWLMYKKKMLKITF